MAQCAICGKHFGCGCQLTGGRCINCLHKTPEMIKAEKEISKIDREAKTIIESLNTKNNGSSSA